MAGPGPLLGPGGAMSQDIRFFRIGTGTTGGTYFPIGGIIAGAISAPPGSPPCNLGGSCGVSGLIAVAQATSGSVENVEKVESGEFDAALAQADIAFWGYTGTGLYRDRGALSGLRAIARLYAELVHVVTLEEAGIAGIANLAGKRVSLGDEGSGTLIGARLILSAFGLQEGRDYTPVFAGPEQSTDLMLAGEVDAFFIIGGAPLLAVADLTRRRPVRLVPVAGPEVDPLLADLPFFTRTRLADDSYPGVAGVPTLAVGALFVVADRVEEEIVHGITRALWHPATRALLDAGHPRGREITLEHALRGLAIPLHPGAARYYREQGLLRRTSESEAPAPSPGAVPAPPPDSAEPTSAPAPPRSRGGGR
ncbi:MAG: TAXI family TRAP transporter solute-binding subunit [Azospirillaceae bacterium]